MDAQKAMPKKMSLDQEEPKKVEETTEPAGDPKCKRCWGRFYVRVIRDGKLVTEQCQCVKSKRIRLEHRRFEEEIAAAEEKKRTGHAAC